MKNDKYPLARMKPPLQVLLPLLASLPLLSSLAPGPSQTAICAKGNSICIPKVRSEG